MSEGETNFAEAFIWLWYFIPLDKSPHSEIAMGEARTIIMEFQSIMTNLNEYKLSQKVEYANDIAALS